MYSLVEAKDRVVELGCKKVEKKALTKLALSFSAGAMISLGYIAYIKAVATLGSGVGTLVGASLFPIGLLVILLAGGELITGNMMVVGTSLLNNKVTVKETLINWLHISLGNALGAVFIVWVAITLGMFDGIETVLHTISQTKVNGSALQFFVSGMMCNWFVGLSVWLNVALKEGTAKIIGIWFPVMIFVYLGFQHSVANAFLLTADFFVNGLSWGLIAPNLLFAYLGNIAGALIFVSLIYTIAAKD
ncbi:formate/nitrite transporter family protein [Erysipelothrix urinaevulpis]|uniref:formate/nitrite transporter family protein n=1 Tax=Erysipelothrix urinaevulpis TaxID=2683717 RepID=UPI001356E367|nr:formate/nitrite transporter family protein [Erysipelothrix urinaevulpis]